MATWGTKKIEAPDVIQVLGRALLDKKFRKALLANPEKTLKGLGFKPEPQVKAFFEKLKEDGLEREFARVQDHYEQLGGPRNA